jgi:alanine racemase
MVGEPAVLIGRQGSERITAEEIARRLETINYEITSGLAPRVARRYLRDGEPAQDGGEVSTAAAPAAEA